MDADMEIMEMAMQKATPVEEGMIFFMQDSKMMMRPRVRRGGAVASQA